MKNIETSKKILIALAIVFTIFAIFGILYAWKKNNDSVITILAGGLVSALSVAIGFYYWKAKQENIIKLKLPPQDLYHDNDDPMRGA